MIKNTASENPAPVFPCTRRFRINLLRSRVEGWGEQQQQQPLPHLEALSLDVDRKLRLLFSHVERQIEVVELFFSRAKRHLDWNSPVGGQERGHRADLQNRSPSGIVIYLKSAKTKHGEGGRGCGHCMQGRGLFFQRFAPIGFVFTDPVRVIRADQ